MAINLEDEIIASSYDALARTHSYTVARGARRWTVTVHDDDFQQYGAIAGASAAQNQSNRRSHLARRLDDAMRGPADGE